MEKYTLEFLSKEFEKHSIQVTSALHYSKGDFNLPVALKLLVDEIIELREFYEACNLELIREMVGGKEIEVVDVSRMSVLKEEYEKKYFPENEQ